MNPIIGRIIIRGGTIAIGSLLASKIGKKYITKDQLDKLTKKINKKFENTDQCNPYDQHKK